MPWTADVILRFLRAEQKSQIHCWDKVDGDAQSELLPIGASPPISGSKKEVNTRWTPETRGRRTELQRAQLKFWALSLKTFGAGT